jgi:hypothetical protein
MSMFKNECYEAPIRYILERKGDKFYCNGFGISQKQYNIISQDPSFKVIITYARGI